MNDLLEKIAKTTAKHFVELEDKCLAYEKVLFMLLAERENPSIVFSKEEYKNAVKEYGGIVVEINGNLIHCELVPNSRVEECERKCQEITSRRVKRNPPLN